MIGELHLPAECHKGCIYKEASVRPLKPLLQ